LAHLGILDFLEEHALRPKALSGCSFGAIVASLYALAWPLDEIASLARDFSLRRMISLKWPDRGFSRLNKFERFIQNIYGEKSFKDLSLPLTLLAVDIDKGEVVVFREGLLWPAVLASCSLPLIFEPFFFEGRNLVDGGLLALNPTHYLEDVEVILGTDLGLTRLRTGAVKGFSDMFRQCLELLSQGQRLESARRADLNLSPAVLEMPFLYFFRVDNYRKRGYEVCQRKKNEILDLLTA
jgi:NTE family protein